MESQGSKLGVAAPRLRPFEVQGSGLDVGCCGPVPCSSKCVADEWRSTWGATFLFNFEEAYGQVYAAAEKQSRMLSGLKNSLTAT